MFSTDTAKEREQLQEEVNIRPIHLKLAIKTPNELKKETQPDTSLASLKLTLTSYKPQLLFSLHGTKTAPEPPRPWHRERGNQTAEARQAGTTLGRLHFSRLAMARLQVAG